MLAFSAVWIALASLAVALVMLVYRPAMTDLSIWFVLWLGAPLSMCFAGLILWAYRKDVTRDEQVAAQRLQAKVAIALAVVAAAIVYVLIILSQKSDTLKPEQTARIIATVQAENRLCVLDRGDLERIES